MFDFCHILVELFALELAEVHLAEQVNHLLEIVAALLVIVKFEFVVANVQDKVEHKPLAVKRAKAVDGVERILLEDYEVNQLALPECLVVADRNAVVTKDVDLVHCLLTLADDVLGLVYLSAPARFNLLVQIFLDLRIFQILGIGIDRVYGRVALLVCAVLLKSVEAPR